MTIPEKPFPHYKWRWAELTPSEGLNNPLRLIGVLRALYNHQGEAKSTLTIHEELEKIQEETNYLTGEKVTLARTGERNLLRNSDRYWKALGLLDSGSRAILLTPLGIKVAEGRMTQHEFAITVVNTLTLPNNAIENRETIADWNRAGLVIKPLLLILQILHGIQQSEGTAQAYITPEELQKIIIPIAGTKGEIGDYISALQRYRHGALDISLFPNCTPEANDKRMAREFLLFLEYYGFCYAQHRASNATTKFFLQALNIEDSQAVTGNQDAIIPSSSNKDVSVEPPLLAQQRLKKLREVTSRPQQARFRAEVLQKFDSTCLLTGEKLPLVLEACHIIDVQHKGSDSFSNGLCLRMDVHKLFDDRHIRIRPDGRLEYSDVMQQSTSYQNLPLKINIPSFVSQEAIQWRYSYY